MNRCSYWIRYYDLDRTAERIIGWGSFALIVVYFAIAFLAPGWLR